jgi:hypothetical protein
VIMPSYSEVVPFAIGAVAGVPKVIINSAVIGDATIGTAAITDLSVSTLKIRDEAITIPRGATGWGADCSVSITLDQPGSIFIIYTSNALASGYGADWAATHQVQVSCGGSSAPSVGSSLASNFSGGLTGSGIFTGLGAGTYLCSGATTFPSGSRTIGATSILAIAVKK